MSISSLISQMWSSVSKKELFTCKKMCSHIKTLIYRPHQAKIKYALLVEGHQSLGDAGVPGQNVFSNFRKLVVGAVFLLTEDGDQSGGYGQEGGDSARANRQQDRGQGK